MIIRVDGICTYYALCIACRIYIDNICTARRLMTVTVLQLNFELMFNKLDVTFTCNKNTTSRCFLGKNKEK